MVPIFNSGKIWFGAALLALLLLTLFVHGWQLDSVPRGLYADETSIGYNAILVAETGRDEHGAFLPLYFKAFGEYKNPIYICGAALMFYLFGPSEFTLRATSAAFFLAFWVGTGILLHQMFRSRIVTLYTLAAAAFLPWFFTMSRVAFETVSELTVVVYALLFLYLAYHRNGGVRNLWYQALAGLFMGLSIYTHSPRRLLTWAMFLAWVLVYARRRRIKKAWLVAAAFTAAVTPYLYFLLSHPGALTARFKSITYLYSSAVDWPYKIMTFIVNYIRHFGPYYLLLEGDSNLRHAIGYGGELLVTVFVLFMMGLAAFLWKKRSDKDRYGVFLLLNLAAAPTAAALTLTAGTGHVTRTMSMGLIILIVSGYGLAYILKTFSRGKTLLVAAVFVLLALEASAFTANYFTVYPGKSVEAFNGYGFKEALRAAVRQRPEEIVVSDDKHGSINWADVGFYRRLIDNKDIPVEYGSLAVQKGSCLVYNVLDRSLKPAGDASFREVSQKESLFSVRCYR